MILPSPASVCLHYYCWALQYWLIPVPHLAGFFQYSLSTHLLLEWGWGN